MFTSDTIPQEYRILVPEFALAYLNKYGKPNNFIVMKTYDAGMWNAFNNLLQIGTKNWLERLQPILMQIYILASSQTLTTLINSMVIKQFSCFNLW
jgi:hypothetical protein